MSLVYTSQSQKYLDTKVHFTYRDVKNCLFVEIKSHCAFAHDSIAFNLVDRFGGISHAKAFLPIMTQKTANRDFFRQKFWGLKV
jgi:hypothetical protein